MSADQALTRAQERKNSKIDAAITAGRVAQLQKSMNVTLKLTSGGSMRLVSADGTVSPEGRHYYSKLGVEPPSIFPDTKTTKDCGKRSKHRRARRVPRRPLRFSLLVCLRSNAAY